jgi:hypothetical protein
MAFAASYNHGSAQNIDIISQFICDQLTNTCGADQTAKNTCQQATAAADAQPPKTGAQADAFNAAFGIATSFADVTALDDQGNPIAGTSSATVAASSAASVSAATATAATTTASADAAAATSPSTSASTSASNSTGTDIGNFGKCSVPQIEFGVGFDNRKETSFQPVDKSTYLTPSHYQLNTDLEFYHSVLQPWFCSEYRHHYSVHVRSACQQLWRRPDRTGCLRQS